MSDDKKYTGLCFSNTFIRMLTDKQKIWQSKELFRSYIWGEKVLAILLKRLRHDYGKDLIALFPVLCKLYTNDGASYKRNRSLPGRNESQLRPK
jgi:hypothetical protein